MEHLKRIRNHELGKSARNAYASARMLSTNNAESVPPTNYDISDSVMDEGLLKCKHKPEQKREKSTKYKDASLIF